MRRFFLLLFLLLPLALRPNTSLDTSSAPAMMESTLNEQQFAGPTCGAFLFHMASFNFNAFQSGGLKLNNVGSGVPMGPSSPGYVQGTANTIPLPKTATPTKGVLGVGNNAYTGGGAGRTLANPTTPQPDFSSYLDSANAGNSAQLSQLNSEFDYNAANLNNQLSGLAGQKQDALSQYDTQLAGVQKQVGTSKQQSQQQTDQGTQDALSTAQDVERKNRNTLRALGILNSSAAGDVLSRGYTEYDKQRANLVQANTQRLSQLDDFLNQKVAEHADAVRSLENQYTQLTGQIQNDLRFNDRQRASAIQAANAALQQRIADIKNSIFNYQAQVSTMKQNLGTQLSQLTNYNAPTANLQSILGTTLGAQGANQQGSDVAVAQEDPRKRLLSGLN